MKNLTAVLQKLANAPKLTGEQYKVMLTIMSQIENGGGEIAMCTVQTIAQLSGFHPNHVSRSLKFLADNGYLNREKADGTYSKYTLGAYFNNS